MHLNRLVLRNFKKYRRADITFQDGLTGIIGGNGAGKSTIVEAIAWALYGSKASTVERKFIKNVNARPEEPVEVHLTLSIGEKEIIISRMMKGKSMQPDASLCINGLQVAKGVREVDAHLSRLIKISFQDFMRTFYAKQKDLDNLIREGGAGKREYLLKLLGLEDLREIGLEITKEDLREIERRINLATGALSELGDVEKRIEEIRERESSARAELSRRERALRDAEVEKKNARGALELLEGKRREHENLRRELEHIQGYIADRERTIREESARLEEIERKKRALDELASDLRRLNEIRYNLRELETDRESHERLISSLKSLQIERREALRSLEEIETRLDELYRYRTEMESLKERADLYTITVRELEELERKREKFISQVSSIAGLDAKRAALLSDYRMKAGMVKELHESRRALPALERRLSALESLKRELEDLERAREKHRRLGELISERRSHIERRDQLLKRLDQIRKRISEIGDLAKEEEELRRKEIQLEELIDSLNQKRTEIESARNLAESKMLESQKSLKRIESLGAESPCPTCERPLGDQYARLKEKYMDELTRHRSELERAGDELLDLNARIKKAQQLRERLRASKESLGRRRSALASLEAEQREVGLQLSESEGRISKLDGEINAIGQIEYDPERYEDVKRSLSGYNELIEERAKLLARLGNLPALESDLRRIRERAAALDDRILELSRSIVDYDERAYLRAKSVLSDLQSSHERYRLLIQRTGEIEGIEKRLEATRTRVRKLDGDILKVEEELSELGFDPDEYNRLRAEAARLAEIESIANNLRIEIAGEDLSRSRMLEAEADLRRLHAKSADLSTRLENIGYTDSAYENAKSKLSDAEEMLRRTNEEYARMRDELRRLEWNLSDLNEDLKRKRDLEREIDELNRRAQVISTVRDMLVRFMDALLIRVRGEIARNAARIMEEVTGKYSILKIDDNFNILIDDRGTDYPIWRFSGGEIDMIALSVRIAISEYLMRSSGEESGYSFMILDEVFGSQDIEHRERMINMLRSLGVRFPQLFAISHISDVQGQFDSTIVVSEDEMGNSVVYQ
ncbi:MAG: SMC family ATPase [Methanothrix sp.]|uniref:AAA family ATPase n=1 Tax=Methanothrix sp. TaxID=90426 RepID=UPI0025FBC3C3|nr:SMC family ATPase [Methanothrix sp.]MCQ8903969.1 SMC family ATPase [Methanothrix sp.]